MSTAFLGVSARAFAAPADHPVEARSMRVAQKSPSGSTNDVDRIRGDVARLKAERAEGRADKVRLVKHYQNKLGEIDRLKKQRASWRRDRVIRTRMSESHGTAKELSALDQRLRGLDKAIARQEKALMTAIDRELGSGPAAARIEQLQAWKRQAGKGAQRSVKKIVLPEDDIDPLADPEELEYQASLLRQSEEQLAREMDRLDRQAQRYQHMVSLRKKYSRADELSRFDDDRPRRGNGRSSERAAFGDSDNAGAPSPSPPPAPPPPADPGTGLETTPEGAGTDGQTDQNDPGPRADPMFEVVLADVVDASTIKALRAAGVSSDPAVKAEAAAKARKQVKARIERLRKRREMMQKRASQLRSRP